MFFSCLFDSEILNYSFMNAYFNMYLGTELKDKLDETFFSMLPIHS